MNMDRCFYLVDVADRESRTSNEREERGIRAAFGVPACNSHVVGITRYSVHPRVVNVKFAAVYLPLPHLPRNEFMKGHCLQTALPVALRLLHFSILFYVQRFDV